MDSVLDSLVDSVWILSQYSILTPCHSLSATHFRADDLFKIFYPSPAFITQSIEATNAALKTAGHTRMTVQEWYIHESCELIIAAYSNGGSEDDFWNVTPDALGFSYPDLSRFMKFYRYREIMQCKKFHGHDFSTNPVDSFHSIRELVNEVNTRCKIKFSPGLVIITDESFWAFMHRGCTAWIRILRKPRPGLCPSPLLPFLQRTV